MGPRPDAWRPSGPNHSSGGGDPSHRAQSHGPRPTAHPRHLWSSAEARLPQRARPSLLPFFTQAAAALTEDLQYGLMPAEVSIATVRAGSVVAEVDAQGLTEADTARIRAVATEMRSAVEASDYALDSLYYASKPEAVLPATEQLYVASLTPTVRQVPDDGDEDLGVGAWFIFIGIGFGLCFMLPVLVTLKNKAAACGKPRPGPKAPSSLERQASRSTSFRLDDPASPAQGEPIEPQWSHPDDGFEMPVKPHPEPCAAPVTSPRSGKAV